MVRVQLKTEAIDSKSLLQKMKIDTRAITPENLVVARSYPAGGYPAGMAHYIPGNLFCVKIRKVGSFWVKIPIDTTVLDNISEIRKHIGTPVVIGGPYDNEDDKFGAMPGTDARTKQDLCGLGVGFILFSTKQTNVLTYDSSDGTTLDFSNVAIIPVAKFTSKTTDRKLEVINGHIVNTWRPSVSELVPPTAIVRPIYNHQLDDRRPGCLLGRNGDFTKNYMSDDIADWISNRMFRRLAIPYIKKRNKRTGPRAYSYEPTYPSLAYIYKPPRDGDGVAYLRGKTFIYRDFHKARLGKNFIKIRRLVVSGGASWKEVL